VGLLTVDPPFPPPQPGRTSAASATEITSVRKEWNRAFIPLSRLRRRTGLVTRIRRGRNNRIPCLSSVAYSQWLTIAWDERELPDRRAGALLLRAKSESRPRPRARRDSADSSVKLANRSNGRLVQIPSRY